MPSRQALGTLGVDGHSHLLFLWSVRVEELHAQFVVEMTRDATTRLTKAAAAAQPGWPADALLAAAENLTTALDGEIPQSDANKETINCFFLN